MLILKPRNSFFIHKFFCSKACRWSIHLSVMTSRFCFFFASSKYLWIIYLFEEWLNDFVTTTLRFVIERFHWSSSNSNFDQNIHTTIPNSLKKPTCLLTYELKKYILAKNIQIILANSLLIKKRVNKTKQRKLRSVTLWIKFSLSNKEPGATQRVFQRVLFQDTSLFVQEKFNYYYWCFVCLPRFQSGYFHRKVHIECPFCACMAHFYIWKAFPHWRFNPCAVEQTGLARDMFTRKGNKLIFFYFVLFPKHVRNSRP